MRYNMNPVSYELSKLNHEYVYDGDNEHFNEIIEDMYKVYDNEFKLSDEDIGYLWGYYLGISKVLSDIDFYMNDNLEGENIINKLKEEVIGDMEEELLVYAEGSFIDLATSVFDNYAVENLNK